MDYPRSAPSYFTSTLKKLAVSQEATIRCCVRIPLRAFPPSHLAATEDESAVSEDLPSFAMLTHRLRRTRRGPGWDSTVPWFDRQFQVELQGFALPVWREVSDTSRQPESGRWRMMLGSPAAVKDQPASPQSSPRPCGGRKIMPSPIRRNVVRSGRTSRHVARGRPVPPRSP